MFVPTIYIVCVCGVCSSSISVMWAVSWPRLNSAQRVHLKVGRPDNRFRIVTIRKELSA